MARALLLALAASVGTALVPQRQPFARTSPNAASTLDKADVATSDKDCVVDDFSVGACDDDTPPFKKILAANRAEIAVRIMRAGTELNMATVGIYAHEDRKSAHRWCADETYMLPAAGTPVGAYLEAQNIVDIAVREGVEAIHPGYGFLSESDKVSARQTAIAAGVPVIPGTDGALDNADQAYEFAKEAGLPLMIKATMGGGGKGMRIARTLDEVRSQFDAASSEALAGFGDGTCFIERYVENPRHVEIQIIGDGDDVVHLWERDCSVQRRHQKVIEMAPAWNLDSALRKKLQDDAVKLGKLAKYENERGHRGHQGARGVAIQCRITTENPERDFAPDTGTLSVYRHAQGFGMRIDGIGYSGMQVTPFFDSLLVKYTTRASTWGVAVRRMRRALLEMRIRGVKTNVPFLLNVLEHPDFIEGTVDTSFIGDNPDLVNIGKSTWQVANYQSDQDKVYRVERNLRYLAKVAVNGHPETLGADAAKIGAVRATAVPVPAVEAPAVKNPWRKILLDDGPEALAKAVRAHPKLLMTDPRRGAPVAVGDMLLRGANAVGYTSYPDDVVYQFCETAKEKGVDVFRVFDSLNDVENLELGVKAAKAAGGFVEAAICYTGDVANEAPDNKYSLSYYRDLAKRFVDDLGVHGLAIKDMAGLLTPKSATMLVSALRADFPDVPIHVHTHDSAGLGVAAMVAAADAGADIVDGAVDAMSGLTSQPSLGAIAAATDTSLDSAAYSKISSYWDTVRATLYAPFESGQLATASDVKVHEIPGGQYTNLLFQSRQLGLDGRFDDVKAKYAMANRILGDIPKVTPSSKVVGDLAQFMVAQNLMEADVGLTENVARLPDSVVDYLKGSLGTPPGGFPEPLRTDALAAKNLEPLQGRPGASLGAYDFEEAREMLKEKYADATKQITFEDVLSHALYPAVFSDYMDHRLVYGDVDHLPTHVFLRPMKVNDEVSFDDARGRKYFIKLVAKSTPDESGSRNLAFEVNGERWQFRVTDEGHLKRLSGEGTSGVSLARAKATRATSAMKMESTIVAPQDGTVDSILINSGDSVEAEDLPATVN
ncbi:pyruvate carboxylase [Aureococcus anophagefferens]|nr:pyruvate carboxylase [Aureococcus anophagefferens]